MRSRSSSASSAASAADTTQIFVKLPNESRSPNFSIEPIGTDRIVAIPLSLPSDTSTSTILQLVSLRTSIPVASLRLSQSGRHLPISSTTTLTTLSIQPSATLTASLPLRGGMPPKKIRCTFDDCKEIAQRIVGDCDFCKGHFCGKHRMLEDHKCEGLEDCRKESHERNAVKLESEKTQMIRGI